LLVERVRKNREQSKNATERGDGQARTSASGAEKEKREASECPRTLKESKFRWKSGGSGNL